MINTILDLIFLTFIICFIIDVSGVMTDIRKFVAKQIYKFTKIIILQTNENIIIIDNQIVNWVREFSSCFTYPSFT